MNGDFAGYVGARELAGIALVCGILIAGAFLVGVGMGYYYEPSRAAVCPCGDDCRCEECCCKPAAEEQAIKLPAIIPGDTVSFRDANGVERCGEVTLYEYGQCTVECIDGISYVGESYKVDEKDLTKCDYQGCTVFQGGGKPAIKIERGPVPLPLLVGPTE